MLTLEADHQIDFKPEGFFYKMSCNISNVYDGMHSHKLLMLSLRIETFQLEKTVGDKV